MYRTPSRPINRRRRPLVGPLIIVLLRPTTIVVASPSLALPSPPWAFKSSPDLNEILLDPFSHRRHHPAMPPCSPVYGGVCFQLFIIFISFQEIQKLDDPKSEKLRSLWKGASNYSLLGPSSFWIS
jgi:hypothetical protein